MPLIDDNEIDRLAWSLERTGIDGQDDAIDRIVERARPGGVNPVLIDVLEDASEPECARIRAFGRVALHLGSHPTAA